MLIEIVVAVGIIALVLLGVSDLMTRSSRVVTFQKQKDEAITIAQKLQNDYRTQRDIDPLGFYANAGNSILEPCISDTYKCTITMDTVTVPNFIQVTIKVEWKDGGQIFSTSLSQSLSKEIK
ncbi:MAG: hypothetical protein UW88_C0001G0087 [Candidatus Collierbacteria bacterium GW2011_GWD2_45_10]|nr:MAG: hypothetical protein UW88_C0001G0087 [Candidatus Collierbacteria bacterium GW2011_GWD2_45_10]